MLYFSSSAFLISLLFITAVCVLFPIKLRKFNQKVTLQRFLFFFFFSYLIPDSLRQRGAKQGRNMVYSGPIDPYFLAVILIPEPHFPQNFDP